MQASHPAPSDRNPLVALAPCIRHLKGYTEQTVWRVLHLHLGGQSRVSYVHAETVSLSHAKAASLASKFSPVLLTYVYRNAAFSQIALYASTKNK